MMDKMKQKSCEIIPIYRPIFNNPGLNELESNRINELLEASHKYITRIEKLKEIFSGDKQHKLIDRSEVIELSVKSVDLALQEMAKYVKQLNGFNDICLEDQESLVKYAFFEISTLRGITLYDIQTDCFQVYKLIAIQLFNPNRPNIRHKDNIKLQQQLNLSEMQSKMKRENN
ncbi:unnamed protein product [Oppiella nova]|uniref:NR LBD domain-containing protein n=1 Tax=Oppiella nova TaxID=334625 RepID=A0A7R9LHN6_9ACAR|nr:unnamed protein product [Oppiella nova]CAG2163762.1 unnamed protein product [Oppiella nova]